MLLTLDMGNTNITIAAFDGDKPIYEARLATARQRTADQYAVELLDILSLNHTSVDDYDGAALCSVVPELTDRLSEAVEKVLGITPLILPGDIKHGLKIKVGKNVLIGADLLAASVGAKARYPMPCFIVDLGTATKIIVLDEEGAFCGCTIAPGIGISLQALSARTSQLPNISFSKPARTIGTNSVECMQSGIVYGTAAMIDGLIVRMKDEIGFSSFSVVTTGGYGKNICPCCKTKMVYDSTLIPNGMRVIYQMNQKK